MKVLSFKIPKSENELVRHQADDLPHFYDRLHQHPEVQLTKISKGEGNLIVGDYIGRFKPGDLVLLGPGIPHVFRSDNSYYKVGNKKRVFSESLFYDLKILEKHFHVFDGFSGVIEFFKSLNGCYRVADETHYLSKRITRLREETGLLRLIVSMEILHHVMHAGVIQRLNKMGMVRNYSSKEGKRMEKVIQFIMAESRRPVELAEIAEVASMNSEAFCRFFKQRTRKTFTEFLNEVRITNACQLLGDKDMSISEIAHETGFTHLSYFSRVFKKMNGCTPKEFRNSMIKPAN